MTASLGADAISAVVHSGDQPKLVTEYMPGGAGCQVINTAATGTVYLGTSSAVQPSTGVPVPAGASVQWTDTGQLWVVPGTDLTGPITVVTTDRISSWEPSPETVALAVAAQLLATGIPNVLTETLIGDFVLPPSGLGILVDVSPYASLLLIELDNPGVNLVAMNYNFFDAALTAIFGADEWTSLFGAPTPVIIPVLGPKLSLGIGGSDPAVTHTVRIIGSNRPPPAGRPYSQGYSSTPVHYETGVTAMVAGSTYFLSRSYGRPFQGPASIEAQITAAAVKGYFFMQTQTAEHVAPLSTEITDTNEPGWHAIAGLPNQVIYKETAFPAMLALIGFACTTAGTANVLLRATPKY